MKEIYWFLVLVFSVILCVLFLNVLKETPQVETPQVCPEDYRRLNRHCADCERCRSRVSDMGSTEPLCDMGMMLLEEDVKERWGRLEAEKSDDVVYHATRASGTVESIHIGGRTEVVRVTGARLTKCSRYSNKTKWGRETCLWRLDADIVQPEGRKDYFAPHLDGMIDLKQKSGQLTEHGERPWDALTDMVVGWDQLRCANIVFKDEKPVSLHFAHMKYNGEKWIQVASFEADFK